MGIEIAEKSRVKQASVLNTKRLLLILDSNKVTFIQKYFLSTYLPLIMETTVFSLVSRIEICVRITCWFV